MTFMPIMGERELLTATVSTGVANKAAPVPDVRGLSLSWPLSKRFVIVWH